MASPKDLATRQQVYLERLKAGFERDWLPVQASLRRRIREVMVALEVNNLGELSRTQLNLALAALQDAHLSVTTAGMLEFSKQLEPLAGFSAGLEVSEMNKLLKTPFPPPAINSGMLAFDRDSLRPASKEYAKGLFAGKNATAVASSMKPIRVDLGDDGSYILQDGRHRLAEAEAAGAKAINVQFVQYDPNDPGTRIVDVTKVVPIGELSDFPRFNAPTAKVAYEYALRSPVQATGELLKPFVDTWPAMDAERLSNIVRTGWAQNKPLMEMIRELTGTRQQSYKNGALEVSRRNAGAIIHTATQHTANAARMKVWEDNSDLVKGYTWVSTLDRRTTQQCRSLDGREFEPGKGPMPPLHIRCRSTTVAKLSSEFDFLDEGATRASSGPTPGYVDADETFYSWLKRQPKDYQERAIGKTRTLLLRDGGLTAGEFSRLNLGRDFQPLTLAEMQQMEPEAFKRAGVFKKR